MTSRFIFNKYLTRYSNKIRYEVIYPYQSKTGRNLTRTLGVVYQTDGGKWRIAKPWPIGDFDTREDAAESLL